MGMPVLTIDRAVQLSADAPETPRGLTATAAKSTPTFLSLESLTFPSISLISLGLVQVWDKATGTPATPQQVLVMAGVLGALLIVWGLLGATNVKSNGREWVGQIIVGLLNTALLYGVMLGVTTA